MTATTEAHLNRPPALFRPPPRLPFLDATPGRAGHDFLVLNQRPDLTAGMFPPPLAAAQDENSRAA